MRHLLRSDGAKLHGVTIFRRDRDALSFRATAVRLEDGWLIVDYPDITGNAFSEYIPENIVTRIRIKH